jgi:hypothetical protein
VETKGGWGVQAAPVVVVARETMLLMIQNGLHCRYHEDRVPHVQALSQDERQDGRAYSCVPWLRLPPPSSGELQSCHVLRGPAPAFRLWVAPELPRVPRASSMSSELLK